MDNLLFIDSNVIFFSYYNLDNESFVTEIDSIYENIFNSMNDFFNSIQNKMNTWEKNFFISPYNEKSFTFCPGPNIEQLLFCDGYQNIEKSQFDLYTIE